MPYQDIVTVGTALFRCSSVMVPFAFEGICYMFGEVLLKR